MKVTATLEYIGFSDYWRGNGRRHDDDAGCLFAFYGRTTTVRGIVDQWVDDFGNGGDCDSIHEDVRGVDVRAAILASVNAADYHSGAVFTGGADIEDNRVCRGCDRAITDTHSAFCEEVRKDPAVSVDEVCLYRVEDQDCDECDDDDESPICVVLIEVEGDEDEYTLAHYDTYGVSEDKAGKWQWVHVATDEAFGELYDSDTNALYNDPNEV